MFDRVLRDTRQAYEGMEREVEGPLQTQVQPFLAGNDQRFGLPPWAEVEKVTLEQLHQWLLPELKNGALEISVVGDFDREEVVRLVGRYFAGLDRRSETLAEAAPVTFPAGKSLTATVRSSIDKSVIVIAWPTADYWDINRTRRLHMLASVLDDRLRLAIREKLGATYSPDVFNSTSRVYKDYGMLMARMTVEPGREQAVIDEVLKVAAELRRNGVTDEELERAKAPLMTSIKDTIRSNPYWLGSVLTQSSRHTVQLQWPTSIVSDFSAVTKNDLNSLATKYLSKDRAAIARVQPEKKK